MDGDWWTLAPAFIRRRRGSCGLGTKPGTDGCALAGWIFSDDFTKTMRQYGFCRTEMVDDRETCRQAVPLLQMDRCEDRPAHRACVAPRRRRLGRRRAARQGSRRVRAGGRDLRRRGRLERNRQRRMGRSAAAACTRCSAARRSAMRRASPGRSMRGAPRCSTPTASGCTRLSRACAGADAPRRPYLVSPHGMLDPWAVRRAAWKKRLVAWWFENAHLAGAACLHALTQPRRGRSGRTACQSDLRRPERHRSAE